MRRYFFLAVFFSLCSSVWSRDKKNPVTPKRKKKITQEYLKNLRPGDTITMDSVIIRYKRKDTSIAVYKYKGALPQLYTRLGGYQKKVHISFQEMQRIIDSPLRIADKQNKSYTVVSYLFSYRKKDVYVDDETMRLKTHYEYISYYVLENPLPQKRVKNIKAEIREGEEFWFEKIIVKDAKGHRYFAPDIYIKTQ